MKYIVTWVLFYIVSVVCPELEKKDQFGVSIPTNCSATHLVNRKDTMTMSFSTKDSAVAFYNEAILKVKDSSTVLNTGESVIIAVKLDSIKTETP